MPLSMSSILVGGLISGALAAGAVACGKVLVNPWIRKMKCKHGGSFKTLYLPDMRTVDRIVCDECGMKYDRNLYGTFEGDPPQEWVDAIVLKEMEIKKVSTATSVNLSTYYEKEWLDKAKLNLMMGSLGESMMESVQPPPPAAVPAAAFVSTQNEPKVKNDPVGRKFR